MLKEFSKHWEQEQNRLPGLHTLSLIDSAELKYGTENHTYSDVTIKYDLQKKFHFKFVTPDEYRGIKEFESGNFLLSHLSLKSQTIFGGDWEYVKYPEKIAINTFHIKVELLDLGIGQLNRVKFEKEKAN